MTHMNPWGLIVVLAGVLSIAGGAMDWDWFMNHRKARAICWLCGRGGARIFYVAIGLAMVLLGVFISTGTIQNGG